MVICYHCKQENHEKCISTSSSTMGRCPCEVRKHALKTYVIRATFEVQEFSPSNAKDVLAGLLARNSKLPTMTNMEIVFPLDPM